MVKTIMVSNEVWEKIKLRKADLQLPSMNKTLELILNVPK